MAILSRKVSQIWKTAMKKSKSIVWREGALAHEKRF